MVSSMYSVSRDLEFDFDIYLKLDDGMFSAGEFRARGVLQGNAMSSEPDVGIMHDWFDEIDITNVEILVEKLESREPLLWDQRWIPLPEEWKPYLARYIERNIEWLSDQLEDAS